MCLFANILLGNEPRIIENYFVLAFLIKSLLCIASILPALIQG